MQNLPDTSLTIFQHFYGRRETGREGERLAVEYLIRRGLTIVCQNFKTPVGRNRRGAQITGEIDVIALDGDILCFIEVKTRSSDEFMSPLATIDRRKQRQITRTADTYCQIFGLTMPRRYDAVTVVNDAVGGPLITWFQDYFKPRRLRKLNDFRPDR